MPVRSIQWLSLDILTSLDAKSPCSVNGIGQRVYIANAQVLPEDDPAEEIVWPSRAENRWLVYFKSNLPARPACQGDLDKEVERQLPHLNQLLAPYQIEIYKGDCFHKFHWRKISANRAMIGLLE